MLRAGEKRIALAKRIMGDDSRKLMHMIEWKNQLMFKNIAEDMKNRAIEGKEEIQREIDRYRLVAGRNAFTLFNQARRKLNYEALIN